MKYRKKPVVIEAVRWMGGIESLGEIEKLQGFSFSKDELMDIVKSYEIRIRTPEGEMTASLGDYVIRGVHGEIYPCKPDIFEETYEMAGDGSRGTFDEERFGVVKDDEMNEMAEDAAKVSKPRDEHVNYFVVDGNRWFDDLPERIFVREVGYLDDYRRTGKMPAPIAYVREMAEDDEMSVAEEMWRKTRR